MDWCNYQATDRGNDGIGSGCSNHRQKIQKVGSKRTRNSAEVAGGTPTPQGQTGEKRGCDEEMSWWNCLMLGITPTQSRIVKRDGHQNGAEEKLSSNSK